MKSSDNIKGFFKSTFIYGLLGSARSLFEFFLLPIYARFITPAEFGMLDILLLFTMIGGVAAMMELGNAVFRFYFDSHSIRYKKSVITTAIFAMFINGLMIFGIFVFLSRYLSNTIFGSVGHGYLFIMAGAYIFLNTMITIPLNLLRVKNQPTKFAAVSCAQIAVSLTGIGLFVVIMKWGIAGVLAAKIISTLPALITCFYFVREDIGLIFDTKLLKSMLRYSIPLIPAGIAIWGINGINRVFMLHYLDYNQIGLFSVASKFVVIITLSVIAFQLAWPHFSLSNMNSPDSAELFSGIFNIFTAGGIWLVLGVTLFSEVLIRFAMTPEYIPAAGAVMPLALGMFLYGLFYFFSTGNVFTKTTSRIVPPLVLAISVNIALNLIITPRYGFVGAAWVTAFSYLVMSASMMYSNRKHKFIVFDYGKLGRLFIIAVSMITVSAWLAGMNSAYMLGFKALIFALYPLIIIFTGIIKLPLKSRTIIDQQPDNVRKILEKQISN
ncbi:MAG: oligosaccharide flippase family protein [candidate division Zixibacteria bacterium]